MILLFNTVFALAPRNAILEADFAKKGFKLPKARKTGTTIAGVVYKVSRDLPKSRGDLSRKPESGLLDSVLSLQPGVEGQMLSSALVWRVCALFLMFSSEFAECLKGGQ